MSVKLRVAGILVFLFALGGLILLLARPDLDPARGILPLVLVAGAWIAFACAAWLLRKVTLKLAIGLILVGGIALQVIAFSGPPQNSSDSYRYIWDGRVQAAGIDPYLYAPADAGVAKLRNDFLWSGDGPAHYPDCVAGTHSTSDPAASVVAGCTKINRATVPTIYPPVAEAYFLAVQEVAPADDSTTPIQAAAAAFAVLVTIILLAGLRMLGKDPRLAALWAWCPTVILEAGQDAHVDVVAVAFTLVALLVLARARTEGKTALGGVLLGLAIATKMTPVLVVPAVLRRGWLLITTSAAAAISLVYAPHVLAVGRKVIGFLPGYLRAQGYSTGTGFSIIGEFVHGKLATDVAVLILAAIALAILKFGDPDQPWRGGVLMTAAALVVCTPDYQWYAILLVMLVALDGSPEWLAIPAGGYVTNDPHLHVLGIAIHNTNLVGYGGGAAVACAGALVRYLITGRTADRDAVRLIGAGRADEADGVPATVTAVAEPVIEPTAVYVNPAVSVTIGADGSPAFVSGDAPESAADTGARA